MPVIGATTRFTEPAGVDMSRVRHTVANLSRRCFVDVAPADKGVGTFMARQKLVEDVKRVHREFWIADGRLHDLFQNAAVIQSVTEESFNEIAARSLSRLRGANLSVSSRSIGRWLKNEPCSSYPQATAICLAMEDVCRYKAPKDGAPNFVAAKTAIGTLCELIRDDRALDLSPVNGFSKRHVYSRDNILRSLDEIKDPLDVNDPDQPEFPPHSPRFPATPAIPSIQFGWDGAPFVLKDESHNPTGTHKDRWAWEKLLLYKKHIQEIISRSGDSDEVEIPSMSMISAGSSAFALQSLLALYQLPPLNVLMDQKRASKQTQKKLQAIGTHVHLHDLDEEPLNSSDVLRHTKNEGGVEITTWELAQPDAENFYDWLVCEILIEQPDYIFVPFGTGDLYSSIILFLERERWAQRPDPRLLGKDPHRRPIHVLGATAGSAKTNMDKLFALHHPTRKQIDDKIKTLINGRVIGDESTIIEIEDDVAIKAEKFAKQHKIHTELSGIAALGLFFEFQSDYVGKRVVVVNTGRFRV